MVAPGFGMPADCFLAGKPSFVEFLCDHGYEVWLLDYRGSDHLPSSLTQFTLDDLVGDFKDAVAEVYPPRRQSEGAHHRPLRRVAGHDDDASEE